MSEALKASLISGAVLCEGGSPSSLPRQYTFLTLIMLSTLSIVSKLRHPGFEPTTVHGPGLQLLGHSPSQIMMMSPKNEFPTFGRHKLSSNY